MNKLFILTLIVISALSACKKNSQSTGAIIGKWQEVKLRLYTIDTTTKTSDTTYLHPFTANDFIQFRVDGTLLAGTDHYYYNNLLNYPKTPQAIPANTAELDYVNVRAGYVVTQLPGPPSPGEFPTTDTVFFNGPDTIRRQTIVYSHIPGFQSVSESYYVRFK